MLFNEGTRKTFLNVSAIARKIQDVCYQSLEPLVGKLQLSISTVTQYITIMKKRVREVLELPPEMGGSRFFFFCIFCHHITLCDGEYEIN